MDVRVLKGELELTVGWKRHYGDVTGMDGEQNPHDAQFTQLCVMRRSGFRTRENRDSCTTTGVAGSREVTKDSNLGEKTRGG